MSKVSEPQLYDAVKQAMSLRIEKGLAPNRPLSTGYGLVRAVKAQYLINASTRAFDPNTIPANLCPRDAGSDDNRFSGVGPNGVASNRGGLYTSHLLAPMQNEVLHYARKDPNVPVTGGFPDFSAAINSKAVIQLGITQPLMVVDLSRYNAQTSLFLSALGNEPSVRSALKSSLRYRGGTLEQAVFDPMDYSAARAIGAAVAAASWAEGLQVGTARSSDRAGETGDNVILYGATGKPIQWIRAEKVYFFDPKTSNPIGYDV